MTVLLGVATFRPIQGKQWPLQPGLRGTRTGTATVGNPATVGTAISGSFVSVAITYQNKATVPSNRQRLKVGVAEFTEFFTDPPYPVFWALDGLGSIDPASPLTASSEADFFAGDRAGEETITVSLISSCTRSYTFNVVEPDFVEMKPEPGIGKYHQFGTASVGWVGRGFLSPKDVSFKYIDVREQGYTLHNIPAVATGFWEGWNGLLHELGPWIGVGEAYNDFSGCVVLDVDTIQTFVQGPPYSPGTFEWNIPWEFKVDTGEPKYFYTVPSEATVDWYGFVELCKGGHCENAHANDPNSDY